MQLLELLILLCNRGFQILLILLVLGFFIPSDVLLFEIYYKSLGIVFILYICYNVWCCICDED